MEKKRGTEEIYNYREMVKKIGINQNLHFHSTHTQGNIEAPVPRGIAAEWLQQTRLQDIFCSMCPLDSCIRTSLY